MQFARYLSTTGSNPSDFARKLTAMLGKRITPETVRRYCLPAGNDAARHPRPEFQEAIARITGGEVSPNDWQHRWKRMRAAERARTAAHLARRRRRPAAPQLAAA